MLTLLADHYERSNAIGTRLKGLMVYPTMVLVAAFMLSCFLSYISIKLIEGSFSGIGFSLPFMAIIGPWISPVGLGLLIITIAVVLTNPAARRKLRWRVPAFKEASLAQVASALALLLKSGVPLRNALALVIQLEHGTPAETELARWWQSLADGRGKFFEMTTGGKFFPPLFRWMVAQSGEDLGTGFQRVAEAYLARAAYRSDLMLYSALPCAVLGLGLMIILQIQPVITVIVAFINSFLSY